MTERRVLVCGGENYRNTEHAFTVLDALHKECPIACVIHGGTTRTDWIAYRWAFQRNVEMAEFRVGTCARGRITEPVRNQAMIDNGQPTECVAFPGRGTADITKRARRAGIPVKEVQYVYEAIE